jgi:aminoglycoside phosphotransferase (APT) family kinase protein
VRASTFPAGDLVHVDVTHRNALQTPSGILAAVVDWEGARRGDSVLDLVTLAFGLAVAECDPGVEQRVWDEARRASTDEALVAYVAHMALRLVDWSIRFPADQVGWWTAVCGEHLRRHT